MATQKEEVILEFKIDQADAFTQLEKTKKSILDLKIAQGDLNKAYKAGDVTLEEYISESVRLEAILKKQQTTYTNVQKSVTGHKSKIDELIKSQKKLGQSFTDAAKDINIGGVSIGNVTAKLASFANPATAAIGIVSALGAAYARSTIGAKDLEFAQNTLSAAITITTNRFAELISSSEDGQGIFSRALDAILFRLDPTTGVLAKLSAQNQELLEDLGRTEIEVRDKVNQRLETNQELLTEIQSEQTKYNDKIDKSNEIITNLRRNEVELRDVLDEELKILNFQLNLDKQNEALQTSILNKKKEIGAVERDAEKRVQAIVRLQQNLSETETKRLKGISDSFAGTNLNINLLSSKQPKGAGQTGFKKNDSDSAIISGTLATVDSAKVAADALKEIQKGITENEAKEFNTRLSIAEDTDQAKLQSAAAVAAGIAGIFEQGTALQRAFALLSIGIDTAQAISAATAASEENPANGVTFGAAGVLQFAASLVRILANIASAKQYLTAAAGGGDFVTKGPALMLVGDNPGGQERVTVEPLSGRGQTRVQPNSNLIAMAGGGTLRAGDGGLAVNSLTQETNAALLQANAIKKMPKPVVSVEEFNRVNNRVRIKQRVSKVKGRAA